MGEIQTPVFMPVGTLATVKSLHPGEIIECGAQIILSNTYHLMLRPGVETLETAGGLHAFMGWNRPILTDSGGFQVFSLAQNARVREEGVAFQSHVDGSRHMMTPESVVDLQIRFGSDIMMPLDHLVGLPANPRKVVDATMRTSRWLNRSIDAHRTHEATTKGALFGICQGGVDLDLRREHATEIAGCDVAGVAIGGLSVGESKSLMADVLAAVCPLLPTEKPRYLMGVGSPEDLWNGVAQGIDMFDSVLPTRLARNGALFTLDGRIDLMKREYRDQHGPVDTECDCATCSEFSAAYLHHLLRSKELLGLRLATIHNLRFLMRQMDVMQRAIEADLFAAAHIAFNDRYRPVVRSVA